MPAPPDGPPARHNVILSHPAFRRLWLARSISHVGDGAALIALLLYVKDVERSGFAVAGLLLAQSLPHLLGPLAGAVVDRTRLRRLMIGCDLGQALIFAAIAWWQPPYATLLLMVGGAAILDTTFGPAAQSAVPALVERADLMHANAWMGTSLNLQVALGPFVGGGLVTAFGARGGLAANALSFVISAALLTGLPRLRPAASAATAGILSGGREGLLFVWRHPLLRALVAGLFMFVAFTGVDNVSLVFLTRDVLHASALGFGVVTGAFGIGMLAASAALSWLGRRFRAGPLILVAWLLLGAATLGTGLAPSVGAAAALQMVAGIGNGADTVSYATIVQRSVPPALLGRIFGLVGAAAFAGIALAYVLAGALLASTSPRTTIVIGGAGGLAVLLWAGPVIWRASRAVE
ncbi:MAG: MFS transporter [Candidatus Dormibacteraceae bacterium]